MSLILPGKHPLIPLNSWPEPSGSMLCSPRPSSKLSAYTCRTHWGVAGLTLGDQDPSWWWYLDSALLGVKAHHQFHKCSFKPQIWLSLSSVKICQWFSIAFMIKLKIHIITDKALHHLAPENSSAYYVSPLFSQFLNFSQFLKFTHRFSWSHLITQSWIMPGTMLIANRYVGG